jgi:phage shock protein A
MEQDPTVLKGMTPADAKSYIAQYLTTLKLTEKKLDESVAEENKWRARVDLARSKGIEDLALEAETQANRCQTQRETLSAEVVELKSQIETMRLQLPGLAARERSIDPDLLEQELLISRGYLPGDEVKAETDRRARDLEKNATLDAELEALKTKMSQGVRLL